MEKLSNEILQLITAELCSHCRTPFPHHEEPSHGASGRDLAALCLTSRLFRAVAEPFLYHRLSGNNLARMSLVRHFLENPGLAACVRELIQGARGEQTWGTEEGDMKFFTMLARQFKMEDDKEPEMLDVVEQVHVSPADMRIEMLISLLPNLEYLFLIIDDQWCYDIPYHTGYSWYGNRLRNVPGTGLPKLQWLQVQNHRRSGLRLDHPMIPTMLRAGPNLKEFAICGSNGLLDRLAEKRNLAAIFPPLPLLHTLEIQYSGIESEECHTYFFEQLVENSPSLEHFRVHGLQIHRSENTGFFVTPPTLVESLRPQARVLKSLDIDLTDDSMFGCDVIKKQALAEFTGLKTLKLDETEVCHHHKEPGRLATTCVVDLLPRNVENLILRIYEESPIWDDLLTLASWAKSNYLPELKHLGLKVFYRMGLGADAIAAFEESREVQVSKLKAQLAGSGVELRVGGEDCHFDFEGKRDDGFGPTERPEPPPLEAYRESIEADYAWATLAQYFPASEGEGYEVGGLHEESSEEESEGELNTEWML